MHTSKTIIYETSHPEFQNPVYFQFQTSEPVQEWKESAQIPEFHLQHIDGTVTKNALSYIKQMKFKKSVFDKLKTLDHEKCLQIVDATIDGKLVIHGGAVFETFATHGVPLSFLIEEIIGSREQAISWHKFVDAARYNKWPDYQIWFKVKYALNEADIKQVIKDGILSSLACWMQQETEKVE